MDKEIVWFIGNYCDVVKKVALEKKRKLGISNVTGIITARLQRIRERALIQP